jgi:multiple sugar transport system permease protein
VGEDNRIASQGRWASWLLAPTVIALGVVIVYPIISAIVMSFHEGRRAGPGHRSVSRQGGPAGIQNYVNWLAQQCAAQGGGTVACPPGTLGRPVLDRHRPPPSFFTVVTVLLRDSPRLLDGYDHGAHLPAAAAWSVRPSSSRGPSPRPSPPQLWLFIFDVRGNRQQAVQRLSILWTGSEWPAKWAVIIADAWKTTPFMALLILAGLQMIPAEVYEAAKVDGATAWQRFRMITLPLVKPALMVAILFRTLDALRMFDLPYILTGGANNTTTLSILVINQIRQGFNAAAALSTITFIIIFLVAFIFVRFLGANVVEQSGATGKGKK